MSNENYENARTLAQIEFMGEKFRLCRRRINGKPWRKYLALVYGHTLVAGNLTATDPVEAKAQMESMLAKCFDSRESLWASLKSILEQNNPAS